MLTELNLEIDRRVPDSRVERPEEGYHVTSTINRNYQGKEILVSHFLAPKEIVKRGNYAGNIETRINLETGKGVRFMGTELTGGLDELPGLLDKHTLAIANGEVEIIESYVTRDGEVISDSN